jgi:hypothetical protein
MSIMGTSDEPEQPLQEQGAETVVPAATPPAGVEKEEFRPAVNRLPRTLTRNQLETLRARLQKKNH